MATSQKKVNQNVLNVKQVDSAVHREAAKRVQRGDIV